MGCDIHAFVEVKRDGKWVSADTWKTEEYEGEDPYVHVDYNDRLYTGRNYTLFGFLANVRQDWQEPDTDEKLAEKKASVESFIKAFDVSPDEAETLRERLLVRSGGTSHGFAGCYTGEAVKPIAMPRGLPEDVSPEVKAHSDQWGVDGHSHSWFTLRELQEADWDQRKLISGVVTTEQAEEFRATGKTPDSWAGACHPMTGKERIEWGTPLREHCEHFLTEALPKMEAMGDPDEVRMVFWFDN